MLSSDAAICHLLRASRWRRQLLLPRSDPGQLHLPTTLPPLAVCSRYCNTPALADSLGHCSERDLRLRIVELVDPS